MSDLISREALLEAISNTWEEASPLSIINLISNAPAIERGEAVKPQFPTMLHKMWSGGEVQEWIDENWTSSYTTPQQPQEQDELVKKAVADALEEAAKLCRKKAEDYASLAISSNEVKDFSSDSICTHKKSVALVLEDKIRALIKRNAVKEGE